MVTQIGCGGHMVLNAQQGGSDFDAADCSSHKLTSIECIERYIFAD